MKLKIVGGRDYPVTDETEATEPEAPASPTMFDTATGKIGDVISEQLAYLLTGVDPALHSHVATALADWLQISGRALAEIAKQHDLETAQDRVVH